MKTDMDKIQSELDELNKVLEAGNKTFELERRNSPLQVTDLSETASKYLTDKAQKDLDNKALKISEEVNGKKYLCVYFAVQTKAGNEEKGVKAIAPAINELSEDGLIHSCLSKISSIELADMPKKQRVSAVFAFVLVPEDKLEDIKKKYKSLATEEGGMGDPVEDVAIQLKDGEFITVIRFFNYPFAPKENKTVTQDRLQEEIDRYLAILPKGTIVKSTRTLALIDTLTSNEVIFYNPLMKKIKEVDFEYHRDIETVDGELKQFSMTTGIRYLDKDGKLLYK